MALLNTLGGLVRNTLKSKPARRRTQAFSTNVESLESRCLMTASVGFQLDQLNGGAVVIQGTEHNDNITVELSYNNRNDPYYFGFANDQLVVKQDGNVIAQAFINADFNIPGTSYINKIEFHGGNGNDTFHNDTMLALKAWGDAGNDVIYGGSGNDVLYGGHGNDRLYGGGGHDDLYGEGGHDRLEGGEGSDYLYGGDGNDYLYGGMDNDNLDGGNGHDYLYGGGGSDMFSNTHGDYWTQHGPNSHQ